MSGFRLRPLCSTHPTATTSIILPDELQDSYICPMKCDKTTELLQGDEFGFPYETFSEFVTQRFYNEQQSRIHCLHQGKGNTNPGIDYYTDDILQIEFFEIYGPCDVSHKIYQNLFKNYKEERLEQISEWILEEYNYNLQKENDTSSPRAAEAEVEVSEHLKLFQENKSMLQPFILPRIKLTEEDIFKDYVLPKSKKKNHTELKNLIEYDPELHINQFIVPEISDTKVGDRLADRMAAIVSKHGTGISNTQFLINFKKHNGYFPNPLDVGYYNYSEMMYDVGQHILHSQDLRDYDTFYYPSYLQNLIYSPKDMFFNIWHKLKIVLSLNLGIMKLKKAFNLCSQIFGWSKIDCISWGFDSLKEFVEYLIQYFGDRDYKLLSESFFKGNCHGKTNQMYLIKIENIRQRDMLERSTSKSKSHLKENSSMSRHMNLNGNPQNQNVKRRLEPTPIFAYKSCEDDCAGRYQGIPSQLTYTTNNSTVKSTTIIQQPMGSIKSEKPSHQDKVAALPTQKPRSKGKTKFKPISSDSFKSTANNTNQSLATPKSWNKLF